MSLKEELGPHAKIISLHKRPNPVQIKLSCRLCIVGGSRVLGFYHEVPAVKMAWWEHEASEGHQRCIERGPDKHPAQLAQERRALYRAQQAAGHSTQAMMADDDRWIFREDGTMWSGEADWICSCGSGGHASAPDGAVEDAFIMAKRQAAQHRREATGLA